MRISDNFLKSFKILKSFSYLLRYFLLFIKQNFFFCYILKVYELIRVFIYSVTNQIEN